MPLPRICRVRCSAAASGTGFLSACPRLCLFVHSLDCCNGVPRCAAFPSHFGTPPPPVRPTVMACRVRRRQIDILSRTFVDKVDKSIHSRSLRVGFVYRVRRIFDYHTRHVDFDAPAPPLPECLTDVVREMGDRGLKPSHPDQLTLNEYKP